jgi:soluble lytic murein transglycosylase-like protein
VKKLLVFILLMYAFLFLGSGRLYEYRIKPPTEAYPVIYRQMRETENTLVPPRRKVPEEYRLIFDTAINAAGIPPGVMESIAFVESGFTPSAVSPVRKSGYRDMGMFQFNSKYLDWYSERYGAFDPLKPEEAASVAAMHIRFLYDRYGHWPTVCLAYNAGMDAVDKNDIPDSSFRYLAKIYEGGNDGTIRQ